MLSLILAVSLDLYILFSLAGKKINQSHDADYIRKLRGILVPHNLWGKKKSTILMKLLVSIHPNFCPPTAKTNQWT